MEQKAQQKTQREVVIIPVKATFEEAKKILRERGLSMAGYKPVKELARDQSESE